MITITFDEQGDFENTNANGHIFIAGFLFDDLNQPSETDNERKRIYRYYKAVCEKAGTSYPEDLHVNHAGNNHDAVRRTKIIVNRTLASFIKDGVFLDPQDPDSLPDLLGMDKRKGRYYLFMKLRSEKGRKDLLGSKTSTLVKDNYAANLYIHMAEEVFEQTLFNNPYIPGIDHVYFDLPTRMAKAQGTKKDQFKYLNYREFKDINPNVASDLYQIGNADVYRTALDLALKNTDRQIKTEAFRVSPIRYSDNSGNSMSFLHLADSVCSLIGFEPKEEQPSDWIFEVKKSFKELSGHDYNLVFAYDDADVFWQKAFSEYQNGEFYEALSLIYDGKNCGSSMIPYYSQVWWHYLEDKMASTDDLKLLNRAAEKLQELTYTASINQEKLLYSFDVIHKAAAAFIDNSDAKNMLFALYDAGAAAYTHTGHAEHALEYRRKSLKFSKGRNFGQVLRMRNRLAVSYCDQLNFEEALKTVNDTIEYEKTISDLQILMNDDDSFRTLSEGRAFSQRGQIYAFMHNPKAEEDFLQALDILSDYQGDYLITMSYLLHYYLDTQEKEKYEKYAAVYFRDSDLYNQFANLIHDGVGKDSRINLKFSLFIFVKAIWTFYTDAVNAQLKTALLNIESALVNRNKDAANEINGHPWELIYKYLAFYAFSQNSKAKAQDYIEKSQSILRNAGEIIEKINACTMNEFERLKNHEEVIDPESPLTYMYR